MSKRRLCKLAQDRIKMFDRLIDIWKARGSSSSGHVYIGMVLTEAYFSENPWVSPQYVLSRMRVYSVDTIRRRLEEMVDNGVVEVTEIDTKKVYRAVPEIAEATVRVYEALTPRVAATPV